MNAIAQDNLTKKRVCLYRYLPWLLVLARLNIERWIFNVGSDWHSETVWRFISWYALPRSSFSFSHLFSLPQSIFMDPWCGILSSATPQTSDANLPLANQGEILRTIPYSTLGRIAVRKIANPSAIASRRASSSPSQLRTRSSPLFRLACLESRPRGIAESPAWIREYARPNSFSAAKHLLPMPACYPEV